MATASANHKDHPELQNVDPTFRRPKPVRRPPVVLDYLLFFIGFPIVLGFIFSLVGTRLTYGMPYLDSFLYLIVHMATAWWPVCLAAFFIKYCFRSWQPPVIAICLLGLLIALIPAAFMFQKLGDLMATLYPVFAQNRADGILPSWEFEYFVHFIRFSMPILPTFLAGVYGYRYATGVDWFGYGGYDEYEIQQPPVVTEALKTLPATASLIEGCLLSQDAEILDIKAEQHYIHIWTDKGNELVRFRFRDLAETLKDCNGAQVHRSWWVNLEKVKSYKQEGRKMELTIKDDLIVPVSLSYKNVVLGVLEQG